jgi:hypothetical protein
VQYSARCARPPLVGGWCRVRGLNPRPTVYKNACGYLLALCCLSLGGFKNTKAERIRNDIVDITFSAYVTHFQGVLSANAMTNEVPDNARALLKLFLAVPPPLSAERLRPEKFRFE